MNDFSILVSSALLYGAAAVGWAYVFRTEGRDSRVFFGKVSARGFCVAIGFLSAAWWLGFSAWLLLKLTPVVLIPFAIASFRHPLGNDAFELALATTLLLPFYLVKQFVLIYPDRDDWILDPGQPDAEVSHASLDQYVGMSGVVTAPLKPLGTVEVMRQKFSAKSDDGTLLDARSEIVVTANVRGLLHVRRAGRNGEIGAPTSNRK